MNDYIGYEFQIAFIYPNEIGKMVIDLFNDLNKKEEEQKEKIEYENINCQ